MIAESSSTNWRARGDGDPLRTIRTVTQRSAEQQATVLFEPIYPLNENARILGPVIGALLISNSICRGNEIEWRDPSGSGAESSKNIKLEFHFGFRLAFHAPTAQAPYISG